MCNRFRTIYLSGKLCTPGGKSIQVKYDQKSYSIKIILQEHYRHVIIEWTILYNNSVPIKSSKFHFSSTRSSVFCDWSFCLRKGLNCLHTYVGNICIAFWYFLYFILYSQYCKLVSNTVLPILLLTSLTNISWNVNNEDTHWSPAENKIQHRIIAESGSRIPGSTGKRMPMI